jgi:hypothetical protein
MSRIQKRRQGASKEESPAVGGGEGGEDAGQKIQEGGTSIGTRTRPRDREKNKIILDDDDKPHSDDDKDGDQPLEGTKLVRDPPAEIKSKLIETDEEKPKGGRPPRDAKEKISNPTHDDRNTSGDPKDTPTDIKQIEKDLEKGPIKILQPLRTDPLGAMKNRHKKLERLNAESIPEIHFIGKILCGDNIVLDSSEGATCRWRVESTPCWIHLGGELQGQTHVVYARKDCANTSLNLPFDHPVDLHFAESGTPVPDLLHRTWTLCLPHLLSSISGLGNSTTVCPDLSP